MEKRKFKLRYLYEGGATMEDFYDVPVTGIMLENGSRISVHYGSTANNRAADAEEANRTAEENGLMLIEPRDFALIVCRQKEIRGMLEKCEAPLVLAHDYVWTRDAESGETAAYSLIDGRGRAGSGGAEIQITLFRIFIGRRSGFFRFAFFGRRSESWVCRRKTKISRDRTTVFKN